MHLATLSDICVTYITLSHCHIIYYIYYNITYIYIYIYMYMCVYWFPKNFQCALWAAALCDQTKPNLRAVVAKYGGRHYVSDISPFHNTGKLEVWSRPTNSARTQISNQVITADLKHIINKLTQNLFGLLNLGKVYLILYFRIAGEELT